MARGRSYVRKGQISDLKIRQGEVVGKVQGTYKNPYKIAIKFNTWSMKQWDTFTSRLTKISGFDLELFDIIQIIVTITYPYNKIENLEEVSLATTLTLH